MRVDRGRRASTFPSDTLVNLLTTFTLPLDKLISFEVDAFALLVTFVVVVTLDGLTLPNEMLC